MKLFRVLCCSLLLAACASGPGEPYWRKPGATSSDFTSDNQTCSARASRASPDSGRRGSGVYVPDNRMETPPRPWTNPGAQRAYMECMAERGWKTRDER
jgi:hypothetical protein